jgi:hypothetical protein
MSALGPKQTIPQPRANLPEMSMQLLGRQIHPTFENDTYVVLPSPSEVAFANCEKVVERDVIIMLLLFGVIIGRVITVLGHSDVHTHAAHENSDGVPDIGAAGLRGSLP